MVRLIQGFRIETIALIAGYVYAYQFLDLNRKSDFRSFCIKKLKRLYLPCLFFGVIYYFMFYNEGSFDVVNFIYRVTNGAGHLWFLPMLCWCFIVMWIITKYNPNKVYTFILLSLLSMLPIPISLPLGLTRACHFIFYFYAGYQLWTYKEIIYQKIGRLKFIALFVVIYVLLVLLTGFISDYSWEAGFIYKMAKLGILSVLNYLKTIFGILSLFLFVYSYTRKSDFRCSAFVIHLSSVCYGLYIFHQFILIYLYYHTSLPCLLGLSLPWLSFIITLVVSYLLTVSFLKFKLGRQLIG